MRRALNKAYVARWPRKLLFENTLALTIAQRVSDEEEVGNQIPELVEARIRRPRLYAKALRRAATFCQRRRPERTVTFLVEGARRLAEQHISVWPLELMQAMLDEAQECFEDLYCHSNTTRVNTLIARWQEIAVQVYHASGYFFEAARIYQERADDGMATNAPWHTVLADRFMASVEKCNAAFAQGVPETICERILAMEQAGGQLVLSHEGCADAVKAEWRLKCLIFKLRARWLGNMIHAEYSTCMREANHLFVSPLLSADSVTQFSHALTVLNATAGCHPHGSEVTRNRVQELAENSTAHPDWRGDAHYWLYCLANADSNQRRMRKHLKAILDLPPYGAHVARALARCVLYRIKQDAS